VYSVGSKVISPEMFCPAPARVGDGPSDPRGRVRLPLKLSERPDPPPLQEDRRPEPGL